MRRMLKEAMCAEGEHGGLLSELHAAAGTGVANSAVVSSTTGPLSSWKIHGGMIVSHSRPAPLHSVFGHDAGLGVTFTHDCAEPGRSKNPGHHDREESYRSCGSVHHFSETVPQTG